MWVLILKILFVSLKAFLFLVAFFAITSSLRAQGTTTAVNLTDSTITTRYTAFGLNDTIIVHKKNALYRLWHRDVYFTRYKNTRNEGQPASIAWFDDNGKIMRSPLDSIKRVKYTDTAAMLAPYLKTAVAIGMFLTTQNVYGADTGIMKVGSEPTAKFKINTSTVMMAQRATDSITAIRTSINGKVPYTDTMLFARKTYAYSKSQSDIRYLQAEIDGSTSNEIQTLGGSGRRVTLTSGGSYTVPLATWDSVANKPTFATVATTGSYNDLANKPTIPTNTNQLTNGAGFLNAEVDGSITNEIELPAQSGQSGKVLGTNGSTPSWVSASAGTVTSIGITSTDFTISGGPVTSSGNITANLATSGVAAGTYEFLTVNTKGIVTGGYNSSSSTLSSRTFGTAYQASNTSRIFDLDFTIRIAIGATLISASDGQVVLETSVNGTTGWTEYTRSQNSNGAILGALNSQTVQIVALNLPAGTYYRLQPTANSGTVTNTYITGHEILRR